MCTALFFQNTQQNCNSPRPPSDCVHPFIVESFVSHTRSLICCTRAVLMLGDAHFGPAPFRIDASALEVIAASLRMREVCVRV
jgi:hypothetical protein